MSLVIGTAGHIDHGKTALVRALTGMETDRLPEERERGISIALGFAHLDGPDGGRTGVVDVPGHERFIRTMLAGAHGIDLVLFVVAADDGVMPQSEEHLDILHVLGVDRGIFVITKTDLVDYERVLAVREEIEILVAGTTLEGAPIRAVSATTGEGIEALREAILAALDTPRPRVVLGPFRMPIDRCFVMHGHGLVVTGTAIAGSVQDGEQVRVEPGGRTARIRGLQVHGVAAPRAGAGQRIAINLGGIDQTDAVRGAVVCGVALDRATTRFDTWIELRPSARITLGRHTRVRVYVGTAERHATIVLLGGRSRLSGGEGCFAQVVLREPVVALGGDRFVVRDETARWTLGGGVVLSPFAVRHRTVDARVPELLDAVRRGGADAVTAWLRLSDEFGATGDAVALALGLDPDAADDTLRRAGVVPVPDGTTVVWVLPERLARVEAIVCESVAAAYSRDSATPGVPLEELRSRLPWQVPARLFRWVIDRIAQRGLVERSEDMLRDPAHEDGVDPKDAGLADRIVTVLGAAGLMPPTVAVLATELGESPARIRTMLSQLGRVGRVVRVTPELYYHPDAAEAGKREVEAECRERGEITAAVLRDRIGASRKFAIAFLDWCDRTGFTTRIGDVRRLRR